jgi:hypothetical protein
MCYTMITNNLGTSRPTLPRYSVQCTGSCHMSSALVGHLAMTTFKQVAVKHQQLTPSQLQPTIQLLHHPFEGNYADSNTSLRLNTKLTTSAELQPVTPQQAHTSMREAGWGEFRLPYLLCMLPFPVPLTVLYITNSAAIYMQASRASQHRLRWL